MNGEVLLEVIVKLVKYAVELGPVDLSTVLVGLLITGSLALSLVGF
jgi:hypothetical protein